MASYQKRRRRQSPLSPYERRRRAVVAKVDRWLNGFVSKLLDSGAAIDGARLMDVREELLHGELEDFREREERRARAEQ